MNRTITVKMIVLAAVLMLVACNTPKEVPFIEAHNYFVRNDAPMPVPTKITTQEEFDSVFGMAAFMGADGQPTPIDFTAQFILPVVLPVTNTETQIVPLKVECRDNSLLYTYKIQTGEQLSFSIRPLSIIILDKQWANYDIILKSE